jgi:hypothetical protein
MNGMVETAKVRGTPAAEPNFSSDSGGHSGWIVSLLAPAGFAVALFYLLYEFLLAHVEADQAFYLYAAQRVLSGVSLDGPRLIETNPPLIVWFSEIPAGLAMLLHSSPVLMLKIVVALILGGSILWSARIMRLVQAKTGIASVVAVTVIGLVELTIRPAEFGQREQLFVALLMPYLLAVGSGAISSLSRLERCAMGASAGLAICFKPQDLITLACLELFLLIYKKSARRMVSPELLSAALTCGLYVAAVRLVTPAYLLVITPLLTDTYWALGKFTFSTMMLHLERTATIAMLLLAVAWFVLRGRLRIPQLSGAMLACGVGGVIALDIQHAGFYHHTFPATVFLLLGGLWMAIDLGARGWKWEGRRRLWFAAVAVMLALVGFAVVATHNRRAAERLEQHGLNTELATYPPGTSVYIFTVHMTQFPVILDRGLVWSSRFAHLWVMPAILENLTPPHDPRRPFKALSATRVDELAALQRKDTAEDLHLYKPRYIFVERCAGTNKCDPYTVSFDYIAWFSKSPDFVSEWSQYEFQKTLENFDVYIRRP